VSLAAETSGTVETAAAAAPGRPEVRPRTEATITRLLPCVPTAPPVPLEADMQAEIDAMIDSGVPPDHPKVEMLEEALAELEAGGDATPPPEPGVDIAATLEAAEAEKAAEASGSASRSAAADAGTGGEPAWESGVVECEVVPGLLGPDEIAGAQCVSVPQPDGTSRYEAIGPDGTLRSVAFGHDGDVRRLDDTALGAPLAPGTVAEPTPAGDMVVTPAGQAPATVDLG
jgi:hypothetical protein